MDSACVIYHFDNPQTPTGLINLGLPNGSSAQTIFEAIDQRLGNSSGCLKVLNTPSVDLILSGGPCLTLIANVNISAGEGNQLTVLADGLFVPAPDGKVKIDAADFPDYLENKLVGGTDGCVSITVNPSGNVINLIPSLSINCLAELTSSSSTYITTIGEALCNSESFLSCLGPSIEPSLGPILCSDTTFIKCIENQLLNDSNFINSLVQQIVNNSSAFALLCQAISTCAPSGDCASPTNVVPTLTVNGGGGTVNLSVAYTAASPAPADGYILYYREVGGSSYTAFGPTNDNPIVINDLPAADYEGYIVSDCGGGSFSSGSPFTSSGQYYNVNTTNDLTGMTIQTVTGIPGYTLHGPVPVSGSDTGLHGTFTGDVQMTLSGTAGINGNASLIKNGDVLNCQNITSGTSPTFIDFGTFHFVADDQIEVTLNTGHC